MVFVMTLVRVLVSLAVVGKDRERRVDVWL